MPTVPHMVEGNAVSTQHNHLDRVFISNMGNRSLCVAHFLEYRFRYHVIRLIWSLYKPDLIGLVPVVLPVCVNVGRKYMAATIQGLKLYPET